MVDIYYPESLPAPRVGTSYQIVDPQLRTPLDNGREVVRRRFTAVPVAFPARWVMGDAQAVEFEEFYRDDLIDGTEWFYMRLLLPQGLGPYLVQFRGAYVGPERINAPGAKYGIWQYSANMNIFLRPGTDPLSPPGG